MPISDAQFNSGLDNLSQQVLEFLQSNKVNAYTFKEIAKGIGFTSNEFWQRFASAWIVGDTLSKLVSKGLIEQKTVGGIPYYRVK